MSGLATGGTPPKFLFKSRGLFGTEHRAMSLASRITAEWVEMGKAERYRRYAAECIRLAQQVRDISEKDTLLAMAESWRRLAERVAGMPDDDAET